MTRDILTLCALLIAFNGESLQSQTFETRGFIREWISNYVESPQDQGLLETRLMLEMLSATGENTAFKAKAFYLYDGITKKSELSLQEAFIDLYFSKVDIRIGKQIVAWGKADELNPSDILNPQNMSNFLEEKGIRKTGLMMVKSDFHLGEHEISLIWKPDFDHFRFPPSGSRNAIFPFPMPDGLMPTIPESSLENSEWALKYERILGQYDVSVSYFNGWENIFTPVFYDGCDGTDCLIPPDLVFKPISMIAADFAGSLRSFGIWGEAAYFITEDNSGTNPQLKNPYLQTVIGSDYTFQNGLKINVQYFKEILTKIDNSDERRAEKCIMSRLGLGMPLSQALSSRISNEFGSSYQHSWSLFSIIDTEKSGYMIQPKLSWSPEDAVVLDFGAVIYGGNSSSLFGMRDSNDELFVRAIYNF